MQFDPSAIEPHLEQVARDWSTGVEHGGWWPAKIVAAKHRAVEGSWKVVDLALDVAGGFGIFAVAKTALGIGLDDAPRWG